MRAAAGSVEDGSGSAVDERDELTRRCAALGVVSASELGRRRGARPASSRAATAPAGRGPATATPLRPVPDPPPGPVPAADPVPGPEPLPSSWATPQPGPVVGPGPAGPDPGESALPVAAPISGLLPWGGLRRGSTVSVHGSTALLLALLAEASRAGSWCALVGLPGIGAQAAAEAGLDLARTALVPRPGPRPAAVVAALVDGVDLVVLGGARAWRAGDRQRLAARVRQRGAVLVPVGEWPGADAELHASGGTWSGLLGDGAGRLRSRRVHLRCSARGRARDRTEDLLLPGPGGRPCPVEPELDAGLPGLPERPGLPGPGLPGPGGPLLVPIPVAR